MMVLTGFHSAAIHISNNSSLLMSKNNTEIAMRFSSSVKNGDSFYTDLNGFQVVFLSHFAVAFYDYEECCFFKITFLFHDYACC